MYDNGGNVDEAIYLLSKAISKDVNWPDEFNAQYDGNFDNLKKERVDFGVWLKRVCQIPNLCGKLDIKKTTRFLRVPENTIPVGGKVMSNDDIFEKAYESVILWENQCIDTYELEQPIKELIEIGNNGHIKALMVLASLSKFDLEELEGTSASDWYCKAASFGSLYAKYKYIESQLGKIDFVEVEKELVSLGKKGYIPAYSKLGVCYARGIGVTKDREVAAPYLKIAADGGSYEAGLQYAELLEFGEGVEKNIEEAVYYLKKCVEIARKNEEDREFNSYTSSSNEETECIDIYEDAKEMFHQFLEDNKLEISRL